MSSLLLMAALAQHVHAAGVGEAAAPQRPTGPTVVERAESADAFGPFFSWQYKPVPMMPDTGLAFVSEADEPAAHLRAAAPPPEARAAAGSPVALVRAAEARLDVREPESNFLMLAALGAAAIAIRRQSRF